MRPGQSLGFPGIRRRRRVGLLVAAALLALAALTGPSAVAEEPPESRRRDLPPPVVRPGPGTPRRVAPAPTVPAPRPPTSRPAQPAPCPTQPALPRSRVPAPPPPPSPATSPRSRPAVPFPPARSPQAVPVPPAQPLPGEATPSSAPLVPGEERPVIRRIEFEGNALFASESLKVLMELKEGERLEPYSLDRDMELLFRFFESVRVRKEQVAGGIVLRFLVSENPLVIQLNIHGVEEFEDAEIREMLSTKVGFPLFPYALATDAEDIVEIYRMRGYYHVQVPEPSITTVCGGGRRIDFTVVEGPEVEVDRIVFRGNTHICRADLLEVMRTEEEGFIPFLSDAIFRMDTLLEDLVALRRRVEAEGFLDAEVVLDDLRFSDDKENVVITIAIIEHQPYTVGDVEIEIERLEPGEIGAPPPEDVAWFTEERIQCWLGLRPGRRYSGVIEEKGRRKIQEEYFKRSYIDAQVEPALRRGRERENVVDIKVKVIESGKVRLRRLDFIGNEYTRDKILRREARIVPGGYVDRRELDRTLARLQGLGYFERVTMQIDDARERNGDPIPGWKDVSYEIGEGSTGQLNFGVGISTDGGVAGSVSFSKRNFDIARWPSSLSELTTRKAFTGAGQVLEIFFAIGTLESQFSLGFTEPRLFGSKLSFNTRIYRRLGSWESYQVDRLGYILGLGYPLYEHPLDRTRLRAGFTWRHENAQLQDIGNRAVPGVFLFAGDNEIRSVEGRLVFQTIDDIVDPGWTTSTVFRAELGGAFLGGDVDFYKLTLDHSEDWKIFRDANGKRHRLSTRVRLGYAEALEDTPEVPPFERFYAGGNTLRGFAFRGVGPMVNGRPTGGEWLVNASVEYEYPLVEDTLGVVAFVDSGTLATSLWEEDAGLWRLSVGLGLRILIPAFGSRPLALDFGFPLLYEDSDERSLVAFALGRDF